LQEIDNGVVVTSKSNDGGIEVQLANTMIEKILDAKVSSAKHSKEEKQEILSKKIFSKTTLKQQIIPDMNKIEEEELVSLTQLL